MDDFCITHGYEFMKSKMGNPTAYCEKCEEDCETATEIDRLRGQLAKAAELQKWLDERGRNSKSYGSHADAYEVAARKLREALIPHPPI